MQDAQGGLPDGFPFVPAAQPMQSAVAALDSESNLENPEATTSIHNGQPPHPIPTAVTKLDPENPQATAATKQDTACSQPPPQNPQATAATHPHDSASNLASHRPRMLR